MNRWMNRDSFIQQVLNEEYVVGSEYWVDSLQSNGKCRYFKSKHTNHCIILNSEQHYEAKE